MHGRTSLFMSNPNVQEMGAPSDPRASRNDIAAKLVDAGIWIFFATALSLTTSGLYAFMLSEGLSVQEALSVHLRSYLEIQDYLQITAYWLGFAAPVIAGLVSAYYAVTFLMAKGFFPLRREPGQKWFLWLSKIVLQLFLWLYVLLILVFLLGSFGHFDPSLTWAGFVVFAPTFAVYFIFNTNNKGWIKNESPFWRGVRLIPAMYVCAALQGFCWEPQVLRRRPVSAIYLTGSDAQMIRARVMFSLTKYFMAIREADSTHDRTFLAIPAGKIDRIETPRSKLSCEPTPTATPARSQTPTSTATPTPSLPAQTKPHHS
jgi:hypothetical protein